MFFYDRDGLSVLRKFDSSGHSSDFVYLRNAFGDIIALCQDDGQSRSVVARYVYDAWGNHRVYGPNGIVDTSASFIGNINPFRYRGYYFDSDTNLYYLISRYYDPEIGQFISPDNFEYIGFESISGINLYAYCSNNPVNSFDPNGHIVISVSTILIAAGIGALAGAIIGGVAGGINAAATHSNVGVGIVVGALGGGIMGAGAGVASLFLAPVIAGEGIIFIATTGGTLFGTSVSTGLAIGIGIGASAGAGVVGGGLTDLLSQVFNDGKISDWISIGISAFEGGALNTLSGILGAFGGTTLSTIDNLIMTTMLNTIPSGYGSIADIIRYYLKKRKEALVYA